MSDRMLRLGTISRAIDAVAAFLTLCTGVVKAMATLCASQSTSDAPDFNDSSQSVAELPGMTARNEIPRTIKRGYITDSGVGSIASA